LQGEGATAPLRPKDGRYVGASSLSQGQDVLVEATVAEKNFLLTVTAFGRTLDNYCELMTLVADIIYEQMRFCGFV